MIYFDHLLSLARDKRPYYEPQGSLRASGLLGLFSWGEKMTNKIREYRPFSSGSEFGDWELQNCEKCTKRPLNAYLLKKLPCDIDQALLFAYFDTGVITKKIASRMGLLDDDGEPRMFCGPCTEFEERKGGDE